ncbi:MAG TPA: hypothetical protein VLJ37_04075 [bacterium]|nr:hypothetical protein [bacterium]
MEQANVIKYAHPIGGVAQPGISFRKDLAAAVITGQLSGLIMAVVMMAVFTIFLGKGPLYPVQVIGSFVFGEPALQGFHLPAFLAGLGLHQFGPPLFWSILFGSAVHSLNVRGGTGLLILGAAIGLLSQIVDVNLIMPAAMKALHGHDIWAEQVPTFWSWAAHLVFGFGLSLFPRVANRLSRRTA